MHFLEWNVWISIKISPKFVPNGLINNIQALVQIMAWRRLGDKPLSELSEPVMVSLLAHICVTRPQWVNTCHAAIISDTIRLFVFTLEAETVQIVESFPHARQALVYIPLAIWWPSDATTKCTSSRGICRIYPQCSNFTTISIYLS